MVNFRPIRQDVRRELGHGHPIARDIGELQRLAGRLEGRRLNGRERIETAEELWRRARDVENELVANGLRDLGGHVVEEASEHHPDVYRDQADHWERGRADKRDVVMYDDETTESGRNWDYLDDTDITGGL